ncbi:O-antigen ligase family protein [Microbacterium sp. zg.Y909]|uniref:O-antigen ligase family protein n=1 Tax=Microbacterium sp. zg.Y909 TaxID=2969413 RepID=UPI00214AA890|nr:O-antigen ligase family protein [Microbacterium sp. zg.Y909]MCR2823915.1 O-antigen ligase family protein [Microbacterium sp. zg.Y909]
MTRDVAKARASRSSAPASAPSRSAFNPAVGPAGDVPLLLRFTAFSLFFFPSSMVIDVLGAAGTVPMILSCLLLVFWLCSWAWGLHHPLEARHPGRLAGFFLLVGISISYVALYGGWSGASTATGLAAADRWLILVAASLGLILVAGDSVRTMADALQLLRWLLGGAFFCCVVGLVQFVLHVNPMAWIQMGMPGFTYNGGDTAIQARGNLMRVAGSTFHSIEFAVVSAMLTPLSIWRAMYDPRGRPWFHWLQTSLLVFAVAATVSRSGILGAAVALAVFVPFMPPRARRGVLVTLPIAVVLLFLTIPGFVATLSATLLADESDPSIATRTNNYPRVMRMLDARPLFGVGPGNYTARGALEILDNQYLNSAVSLGLIGLACIVIYLWFPALTAVDAARRASSGPLKSLAAACGAGLAAAAVCSVTFDSLSFPVFALCYPLLVGLAGGVWQMTRSENRSLSLSAGSPLSTE